MCLETHEQANIYHKSITSKKKKKKNPKYLLVLCKDIGCKQIFKKYFFIRDR